MTRVHIAVVTVRTMQETASEPEKAAQISSTLNETMKDFKIDATETATLRTRSLYRLDRCMQAS